MFRRLYLSFTLLFFGILCEHECMPEEHEATKGNIYTLSLQNEPSNCRQKWIKLTKTLTQGSQEEFKTAIWPFANATKNSYTWNLDEPVTGWTLIRERKPLSGMHALAYQNDIDKSLVLIAIRGTQLGGTPLEEQNDLCADWWLLDRDNPPYEFCSQFTEDQINYFQQLVEFVYEIDEVLLPLTACKIHTGHSLGALLGALASAYSYDEDLAVVFAPPGPYTAAKWLDLPLDYWFNVYSYYSEYDPITVLPESFGNQTGTLCALKEKEEPESCRKCYDNPHLDLLNLTTPCGLCFMQMHIYSHYLDLIFKQNVNRTCSQHNHGDTSGAWSLLLRSKHVPSLPDTLYMILSITVTVTLALIFLNIRTSRLRVATQRRQHRRQ